MMGFTFPLFIIPPITKFLFGCYIDRKYKRIGIVKYHLNLTNNQILFSFVRLNTVKVVGYCRKKEIEKK